MGSNPRAPRDQGRKTRNVNQDQKTTRVLVTPDGDGERLDVFLSRLVDDQSRDGMFRVVFHRGAQSQHLRLVVSDARITLVPSTHDLFLAGLALYEERPDKAYSLVDCMSMQVMRREELTDVLTNDHHCTQEGFQVVFR